MTRLGFRIAAAVLAVLPVSPFAAAPADAKTAEADGNTHEVYRMKLGRFTVLALGDGVFQLPADQLLVGTRPGEVDALLAADSQPAMQPTSVNAYLIDTGTRQILIDSGGGSYFGAALGKFLGGLKAAGYKPEDIDEILITHLHPDHIGGLAVDGRMVFPNATVRLEDAELQFWSDKANAEKVDASVQSTFDAVAASLAPYRAAGRVSTFAPGAAIEPGISSVTLPGHTAGHSGYRISSAGQEMLVWGDVMHVAVVQLQDAAVTIKFDYLASQAAESRKGIMGDAASRGYLVAGSHMKFPGIGRLRRDGEAWRWIPVTARMR